MSQDNQNVLTEFGALTPEDDENSGLVGMFYKFFKKSDGTKKKEESKETQWEAKAETDVKNDCLPIDVKERRSLPSVTKRISSLLMLKTTERQSYNDTELKQYWMPDSVSKECYACEEKFTTFRRRHHCRVCGQIFCSRCCNQEIPGKIMNCTGDLRVCGWCGRAVLSVLQTTDVPLTSDLLALLSELQAKFGSGELDSIIQDRNVAVPEREESRRKQSVGYQEERFGSLRLESSRSNLRGLLEEATATGGIVPTSHRYRLRTYHFCFPAIQLIDWLVSQNRAADRIQAVALGQAMLKAGHLECVSFETNAFADNNLLYRILPVESFREDLQEDDFLHERSLRPTASSFNLDLNFEDTHNRSLDSDMKQENDIEEDTSTGSGTDLSEFSLVDWNNVDINRLDQSTQETLLTLRETFSQHCSTYLRQLLIADFIPQSWAEVIVPLAEQVVKTVRPEKSKSWSEAMDIRQYVQIKKICGGDRRECEIINGIVCSKNLTHRSMPDRLVNPQILLLASPIMYQRVEGKYVSLEPLIMQENDYIQRTVSRIVDLGPNLVIVGKSVTRIAQELLLSKNISLVLNVKPTVLERLARLTGADILSSVDAHLGSPKLGTCKLFRVTTFPTENGTKKTLMMFEGCKFPELGCTIILRGGNSNELSKVKSATSAIMFAYYNARQEISYHMDSGAKPPNTQGFLDKIEPDTTQIHKRESQLISTSLSSSWTEERQKAETVSDFSDPLRGWEGDNREIDECLAIEEIPLRNKFRKALEDNILSVSPYLKFSLPYLESEKGRNCPLRCYFGKTLYWSEQFDEKTLKPKSNPTTNSVIQPKIQLKEDHEFVKAKLTQSADSLELRTLLANYRASGGQIPISDRTLVINNTHPKNTMPPNKDLLDPSVHQRLPTLFCSYSRESRNAPAFCVDPWIVDMEMYGHLDIPLGCFLVKYCFRADVICGSEPCIMPISQHTRRFVHNGGVVHIKVENINKQFPKSSNVYMWTSCSKCSKETNVRCMSPGAISFSFAKYLELRFHGDMYLSRYLSDCRHSLHQDHVHHFARGSTMASFTYSKISPWEISLPPRILETERDLSIEMIKEDSKTWYLLATQIFSLILNKIMSFNLNESYISSLKSQLQKDQLLFKSKIEELQQFEDESINLRIVWDVEDSLIKVKRRLAEIIEEWNVKLSEAESICKKDDKRKSGETKITQNPLNDVIEGEKELDDHEIEHVGEEVYESEETKDSIEESADEADHHITTIEVKQTPTDKKSVKTILSQLLPNSNQIIHIQMPTSQLEHYTLPIGANLALIVYEKEPSSVIAYALNCCDYRIAVEQMKSKQSEQPSASPSIKRKQDSKENADLEKRSSLLYLRSVSNDSRNSKIESVQFNAFATDVEDEPKVEDKINKNPKQECQNIEVQFNDCTASFKVKIYYAEEFSKLRALVLPEGEEGFIRSLSRCVAWVASGGKSGSNFNKTRDDRFILKAMTRVETQLFMDFAPQYFNYVSTCVKNGMPTLLGKILGVYRINIRNEKSSSSIKLLVMEHLFHGRCIKNKFDLKGSVRNRLVETNENQSETVLLDENLINMTCDNPLYILSHSKSVLMQAIHSDTQFLATQSVMDYSLLVGLDETKEELVIGIIDYIRGYTWDKKLETMVKRIGQNKDPTIIPADEYRERFIAAMHRYFLPVPDRWTGLGCGIDTSLGGIKHVK